MKTILINPPSIGSEDDHLEPSLGLLYIAGTLQHHDFDVEIYEMTGCKTEDDVWQKIRNIPYGDVYGFTTYCTNYPYIKKAIDYIKNYINRDAIIILGGPNASALPEYTLRNSGCDYVIVGEGELAFLALVNRLKNNIFIPKIVQGWEYNNIDKYPLPAWDLVNLNSFNRVLDGKRVISILSSRGCMYNCTHCNSVIMGGGSKKVRYRSTANIIEEIKYLQSLGFNNFRFNDDIFTVNPKLNELLSEIKKLNINYRIFARIEQLTDKMCKNLTESGCKHIAIGLESLNPDNLRFLRKSSQLGLEEKHLKNVKNHGMMSRVYFIVGLQYDTDKNIEKYFEIASKLPFDEFSVYPLIPYPGTEIWKNPEKFGYTIINKDFTQYWQIGEGKKTCFALDHKNYTHHDVERWIKYVYKMLHDKVHQRNSIIAK